MCPNLDLRMLRWLETMTKIFPQTVGLMIFNGDLPWDRIRKQSPTKQTKASIKINPPAVSALRGLRWSVAQIHCPPSQQIPRC